jgi:hypothetical protein
MSIDLSPENQKRVREAAAKNRAGGGWVQQPTPGFPLRTTDPPNEPFPEPPEPEPEGE